MYAIKLLVEFLILNSLTTMSKQSRELRYISTAVPDVESALATQASAVETEETDDTVQSSTLLIVEQKGHTDGRSDDAHAVRAVEIPSTPGEEILAVPAISQLERVITLGGLERQYLGRAP